MHASVDEVSVGRVRNGGHPSALFVACTLTVLVSASCAATARPAPAPRKEWSGGRDAPVTASEPSDPIVEPEASGTVASPSLPVEQLPPLPPPSATSRSQLTPPPNQPAPACPPGKGWDGLACVEKLCADGSRFEIGRGCVDCSFLWCGPNPERRPSWSDDRGTDNPTQFNRSAAREALGNVVLSACKQNGGPVGTGHATVTFHPSGNVSHVELNGGPFKGTLVGACILAQLETARVPPFGGSAVKVGKSFSLR